MPRSHGAMQHEAAIDLDRSAVVDRGFAQLGRLERNVDLLEELRQRHVDRLVDDDAECTLIGVLADVGE